MNALGFHHSSERFMVTPYMWLAVKRNEVSDKFEIPRRTSHAKN